MANKWLTRSSADVQELDVENSKGATIQILLGPDDGVPNFYTRRFTIQPGGYIPLHRHDVLEHEQVVLSGEMLLVLDGHKQSVQEGDCIYIPAGVAHSYKNTGPRSVVFLCMVPSITAYETEWLK